jgi:hypothetical protein
MNMKILSALGRVEETLYGAGHAHIDPREAVLAGIDTFVEVVCGELLGVKSQGCDQVFDIGRLLLHFRLDGTGFSETLTDDLGGIGHGGIDNNFCVLFGLVDPTLRFSYFLLPLV